MSTSSHTSTLSRTIAAATVAAAIFSTAMVPSAFAGTSDVQSGSFSQTSQHVRASRNQYGTDRRGEAILARPEASDSTLAHDQWPCSTAPEFCPDFHGYSGG
jgi:hypothetical protein